MGTKVIDKLRIQGCAAPRATLEPLRAKTSHVAFPDTDNAYQFFVQSGHKAAANSLASRSNPSSAASRRIEVLHRVQQANKGLTSADCVLPDRENIPAMRFLLRGKPVQGDLEFEPSEISEYQRVGHYKTSAKEVYRARHKVPPEQGFQTETRNGMYRAVRSADYDITTGQSLPRSNQARASQFYLGPPSSAPAKKTPHLQRPKLYPLSTAGEDFDTGHGYTRKVGLDLTGHHLKTSQDDDYNVYDYMGYTEFVSGKPDSRSVPDIRPHTNTPIIRRRNLWSRSSSREILDTIVDPTLLNQCLRVEPSQKVVTDSDGSPRDFKLKHFNQYIKKDDHKVNYNNPYRNIKSKERKALKKGGKYVFNSVDSYVHFNKIYPRFDKQNTYGGHGSDGASKIPRIPQINGFSPHCTDTVLLKMMFEMNQPRSVKSSSKYSDVAVHKDLEEFLVVGTPSLSRSASVMSKKFSDRKAKSLASNDIDTHKEEDEDVEPGDDLVNEIEDTDTLTQFIQGRGYFADDANEISVKGENMPLLPNIEDHRPKEPGEENNDGDMKNDNGNNEVNEVSEAEERRSVGTNEDRNEECYSSSSLGSAKNLQGHIAPKDETEEIVTLMV